MEKIDIREFKNRIEEKSPLILNLTNYVTMNFMANALLALGASPLMCEDVEDAKDLLNIVDGININIGTLHPRFLNTALVLAKENNKQKPLILDPVGTGASAIRTKSTQELLPYATVLRANASEILATHNSSHIPKGVDSTIESHNALSPAQALSNHYHIPISISGAIDYTVYQEQYISSDFGSLLMPKITGMGCTLTSVITAFNAVEEDSFLATKVASIFYSLCGELVARKHKESLGFFQNYFIDMLHKPDYDYIQEKFDSLPL